MQKCYEKFPNLNRIGAYATPADLVRKTPEELKRLREAGLASSTWALKAETTGS